MDVEAARRAEVEKYIYLYEKPRRKKTGRTGRYGSIPEWRRLLLRNYYKGKSRVLDIGCGWGASIEDGEALGVEMTGVEVVPKLCDRKGIYLIDGAHKLPFHRNDFDAVSCVDVMEHVRREDVPLVFNEIYRVAPEAMIGISLRESEWECGVLHITVQPEDWWLRQLCWTWQKVEKYPYHGNPKPEEYLVVRVQRWANDD